MSFFYLKMSDKFSTISKASHFCVENKKEYNQFLNSIRFLIRQNFQECRFESDMPLENMFTVPLLYIWILTYSWFYSCSKDPGTVFQLCTETAFLHYLFLDLYKNSLSFLGNLHKLKSKYKTEKKEFSNQYIEHLNINRLNKRLVKS